MRAAAQQPDRSREDVISRAERAPRGTMRKGGRKVSAFVTEVVVLLTLGWLAPAGAAEKIVFALPAVPPVFAGVVALVAKDAGLFNKHGLDVDVKPFDSGAAAAQAVVAGNIDLSLSPTP